MQRDRGALQHESHRAIHDGAGLEPLVFKDLRHWFNLLAGPVLQRRKGAENADLLVEKGPAEREHGCEYVAAVDANHERGRHCSHGEGSRDERVAHAKTVWPVARLVEDVGGYVQVAVVFEL